MDFNDIINAQIKLCTERFVEKRQSVRVAGENADLVYEMSGRSVIISEQPLIRSVSAGIYIIRKIKNGYLIQTNLPLILQRS